MIHGVLLLGAFVNAAKIEWSDVRVMSLGVFVNAAKIEWSDVHIMSLLGRSTENCRCERQSRGGDDQEEETDTHPEASQGGKRPAVDDHEDGLLSTIGQARNRGLKQNGLRKMA